MEANLPEKRLQGQALHGWLVALAAVLAPVPVWTQSPAPAADRSRQFLEECVDLISGFALEPVADHQIVTASLNLLIDSLGHDFADAKPALKGRDRTEALFLFDRALTDLTSRPGQRLNRFALTEQAIRLYIASIDPYSCYFSSDEITRFRESLLANPESEIGMRITEAEGSRLLCFPFPDSSAEGAGIPVGGRLLAVDGISVENRSLFEVAGLLRGPPGTRVSLRVEQAFGRSKLHEVLREGRISPAAVVEEQLGNRVLIKVHDIDSRGLEELRKFAVQKPEFGTVALDLRSCPGGDVLAAVGMAELFLPKGAAIGAAIGPQNSQQFFAKTAPIIKPANLVILHNRGTASAAEFLIGALMCNREHLRVNLQGETTYGKAVAQETRNLSTGGQLRLTTTRLCMPNGETWARKGLDQNSFK